MLGESTLSTQKYGRRIAMTSQELDAFLGQQRTCRLASVSASGAPHVSAIWFVWDGSSMWFYSMVKSQRWTDVIADPRVAAVVDGGHEFGELHGVELRGRVEPVGDIPRLGESALPELETPERLFGAKYIGTPDGAMYHDKRHAWLRLKPEKIASWDFRKTGR
jgi:hypothetical protein